MSPHCPSVAGGQPTPVPSPPVLSRHGSAAALRCAPRPAQPRNPGDRPRCGGMLWPLPPNKATPRKLSFVFNILFRRAGRSRRGRRRFPMVGGGRTKARCSLFCSAASEHSSRSLRGPDRAPLSAQGEERKVVFIYSACFSPKPDPVAPPAAAHPAHPARPAHPAHLAHPALPGWARVYDQDKRALLEEGERKEGVKQTGGSNSICVAWKSEGVFPHFALI